MSSVLSPLAQCFDQAAADYDRAAIVQQRAAQYLFSLCQPYWQTNPPRSLVEAGCGTGFLTQHLCRQFPDTPILALDIAPSMISLCHQRLAQYAHLHCQIMDAEIWEPKQPIDCLISSFSLQWFKNWHTTIQRWAQRARSIAFSVPIQGSFSSWIQAHHQAGYQPGLRALPEAAALEKQCRQIGKLQYFSVQSENLYYPNALDFARDLHTIGAHQPRSGHQPVNLRHVLKYLTNGLNVQYQIAYCVVECS